jgi:phosphoglycerate dehydrogenase-like enzyme
VYAARLRDADYVFGWAPAEAVRGSGVKVLQLPSVGYDDYLQHLKGTQGDFTLCNASGTMGAGIAEHALAMMLALARHLQIHVRDGQEQRWQRMPSYGELAGATACVVGLGNLGMAIVARCRALEMRVIGVRRDASKTEPMLDRVYPVTQLHEAVAEADHVIAILPATDETVGLFDGAVFRGMKQGSYFYNVGRGKTVDESALIAHLRSGHLAGAGLDVFEQEPLPADSPLWTMDNVIVTPHVAGRSAREYDRHCDLLVDNLRRYRAGQPLRNVVDLT